jgi:hypothetical protein
VGVAITTTVPAPLSPQELIAVNTSAGVIVTVPFPPRVTLIAVPLQAQEGAWASIWWMQIIPIIIKLNSLSNRVFRVKFVFIMRSILSLKKINEMFTIYAKLNPHIGYEIVKNRHTIDSHQLMILIF